MRHGGVGSIAWDLLRAEREGAEGLRQRREVRLARLLQHARAHSPFYRELHRGVVGGRGVAGAPAGVTLADLPVVTKADLMAGFDDWVADPALTLARLEEFVADPTRAGQPITGGAFVCRSSGTTGVPGLFVHDRAAADTYLAIIAMRAARPWLRPSTWPTLARRGLRMVAVVGTGGHYAGAGWLERARLGSAVAARAITVLPAQLPLTQLREAVARVDPTVLAGYPSALALLAGEHEAGRLRVRPTLVVGSGESWPEADRRRASAVFGCPVREAFAASECMFCAFSCPQGWLHVSSDWVILEPVDARGRPTPPGRASHTVLLTNLANRAQPLIRYDLGDATTMRPDPCPCGSPLPAMRVAGRSADVLHLTRADGTGVQILPLALGAVGESVPGIRRLQVLQRSTTALDVRWDCAIGVDRADAGRRLAATLAAHLAEHGLPGVRVRADEEPPRADARSGKVRQVIPLPGSPDQP